MKSGKTLPPLSSGAKAMSKTAMLLLTRLNVSGAYWNIRNPSGNEHKPVSGGVNMNAQAKGILRHQFFGTYSAVIALEFQDTYQAKESLTKLGNGWNISQKNDNVLVWAGNSEELDVCKDVLTSFGADYDKIDSVAKSIDYGEPFQVIIPIDNKDQLAMF
jgi:hypothetical protein